jgi:predicted ATPase
MAAWFAESALADSNQALLEARESAQAATLMNTLFLTGLIFVLCGKHAAATGVADELTALADHKGALLWKSLGILISGCALGLADETLKAVPMLTSGVRAFQSTGATVYMPFWLSHLARAHAKIDQFSDAWRCIHQAMAAVETAEERWCEAEVYRTAGEIALVSPALSTKAEAHFYRALAIARQQQAKSWELRAAMSMARLWRDQGKGEQAHDLLASVYGWFTEGFDTLDLKEAKALLEQLKP